jgi:hypothetical protein
VSHLLEALRTRQALAPFYQPTVSLQAAQIAYDNRAEPEVADASEDNPVDVSDMAMELAGRADRAYQMGDKRAAADLYRSAAKMLMNAAEVCQ